MEPRITDAGHREVVTVAEAARLMGVGESSVKRYIDSGKLEAATALSAYGGGTGGTAYRVYVESLPVEAQIGYWQESALAEVGAGCREFDLVGYRERKGEAGMAELLRRQKAALAAHGLRRRYEDVGLRGYTEALAELAARLGVAAMTLYRWERGYAQQGLAGLARKDRADAGQSRSMCLLARDYAEYLMYDERKPTQTQVLQRLRERARELGEAACENCPYRNTSPARAQMERRAGEALPMCDEEGSGMVAPESRHAMNRIVKQIPKQNLCYARYGSRAWESEYLMAAKREKPTKANHAWIGDHHQIDVFVLDRDGRVVRPWLTAWEDACSGMLNGWELTLNPNSDTIADSFARAAARTKGGICYGLPNIAYMDNGMDYRSKMFTGGEIVEHSIGRLNDDFTHCSMLQYLGVEVRNALPYRARSKPIERAFKTLEILTTKFPGWCGNSPENKPQDLPRKLKRMVEKGELMTFDVFAECYKRDVIDAYHHMKGGDGLSPIERYQAAERARTDDPDWATLALVKSQRATRIVSLQGIRINNVWYWHDELAGMRHEEVTVLYQRGYNQSVTLMYKGRFLCEAEPIEEMDMFEADRSKVERHMRAQGKQRKAVTGHIAAIEQSVRGVYREAYAEEIDEQRDRALARVGAMDAHKAITAKAEVSRRRRARAGELSDGEQKVRELWRKNGAQLLHAAEEG